MQMVTMVPGQSPGKSTGVGFHFLLQCMKVKSESEVAQSCLTLCDPVDCSPPGSSVHGILQLRILECEPACDKGPQMSLGFPGGSDGKESACNTGDPGLIPELGRSPGEGNGNPLQYS